MKKKIICFAVGCFSFYTLAQEQLYKEVVLGEIQATFIKDYGVPKTFWAQKEEIVITPVPVLNPVLTPTPILTPIPKLTPIKEYKGKRTREKNELIDNGERETYTPPKPEKVNGNIPGVKEGVVKHGGNDDWMTQKINEQSAWQKKSLQENDKWIEEKKEMMNKWIEDKKMFKKRLPAYKENLVDLGSFSQDDKTSIVKSKSKLSIRYTGSDAVVVPGAFFAEVKDQGKRATCSAFASTRAIEISLAQNGKQERLSDQYIYYASKPTCQSSPCSNKGSWGLPALEKSKEAPTPDIPTEDSCPYSKDQLTNNETQIPLNGGCFNGKFKVRSFQQVKNMNGIIKSLDDGSPVIAGFKLSPNFYNNNGVILSKEANGVSAKAHGSGHAILLVGYMKIPQTLNEGEVCFITANSWGVGWGKGGHACLSEKWVNQYRYDIPFLAVESVN